MPRSTKNVALETKTSNFGAHLLLKNDEVRDEHFTVYLTACDYYPMVLTLKMIIGSNQIFSTYTFYCFIEIRIQPVVFEQSVRSEHMDMFVCFGTKTENHIKFLSNDEKTCFSGTHTYGEKL